MTDATELTLKQILDAPWTRRIAHGVWIVLGFVVPSMLAGIGWIVWGSRDTSLVAKVTAEQALVIVRDLKLSQSASEDLAEQRALAELAWRNRLDAGLTNVQADVGEIKGDIGELKGLIMRQTAGKTDRQGRAILPTYVFN